LDRLYRELGSPTVQRWFDTTQFTAPSAHTYGNSARTYSGPRSDSARQRDLSLIKNIRITEKWNLQFRSEFFNLTNTPRFAPPNVIQGIAQFGTVRARENLPRVIQFGLKLIY
jgi:hypothetical protein